MMFWTTTALIAAAAGLWIALPFLRQRSVELSGADGAISIYRDQIDEVDRDWRAGLITEAEGDAARGEIERRALSAARTLDQGMAVSSRSPLVALGLAGAVTLGGLLLYAELGVPAMPDAPLDERRSEALTASAAAGDLTARIQILIEKTAEDPESFEDWWMLARSYGAVGDHASAADAYRRAAELAGDRPAVLSAYAEAMTLANGNKVPTAARVIFDKLALETGDPRARYYAALARAQAQDFEGALLAWATLAGDSSPEAPWMPLVRRDMVNMARFLKVDLTIHLPDATPEEIAAAGGGVAGGDLLPPQSARADIVALEAALADDPMDFEGWIGLAEARVHASDEAGALDALAEARRHYAAAPFVLQKIDQAERALGLDLTAPALRGPDAEDIAAAAEMTEDDRSAMIEGMVAGLAARLEEQPDDLDGWVMLIRSYRTLGRPEVAAEASTRAEAHFAGNTSALAALRAAGGPL